MEFERVDIYAMVIPEKYKQVLSIEEEGLDVFSTKRSDFYFREKSTGKEYIGYFNKTNETIEIYLYQIYLNPNEIKNANDVEYQQENHKTIRVDLNKDTFFDEYELWYVKYYLMSNSRKYNLLLMDSLLYDEETNEDFCFQEISSYKLSCFMFSINGELFSSNFYLPNGIKKVRRILTDYLDYCFDEAFSTGQDHSFESNTCGFTTAHSLKEDLNYNKVIEILVAMSFDSSDE